MLLEAFLQLRLRESLTLAKIQQELDLLVRRRFTSGLTIAVTIPVLWSLPFGFRGRGRLGFGPRLTLRWNDRWLIPTRNGGIAFIAFDLLTQCLIREVVILLDPLNQGFWIIHTSGEFSFQIQAEPGGIEIPRHFPTQTNIDL